MGANLILPAGSAAAADSTPADPVTSSLRFDTNGKLYRTFGTPNSKKTFTIAFWVKRAGFSSTDYKEIWQYNRGGRGGGMGFAPTQANWMDEEEFQLSSRNETTGVANVNIALTTRFRDPAAWMHIAIVVDTTLGSSQSADRIKIFVNNERNTNYDTSHTHSYYWPAQNYEFSELFGGTGAPQNIGLRDTNNHPLNGYLADFIFIDGAAVEPNGNYIESTGFNSYKPKAFDMSSYSGNSFHLKFEDSSSIGSDSANSNDFSTTNLASHDVMLDTPTKNYATLNPLSKSSGGSLAEGNLKVPFGGTYPSNVLGSIGVSSGKWYWEVYLEGGSSANGHACGVAVPEWANKNSDPASASTPYSHYVDSRSIFVNSGSSTSNSTSFSAQDIIGVALNADADEISFYKNGSIIGSAQSLEANQTWMPFHKNSSYTSLTQWVNFGQDPTFAGNKTSGQDTSQSEFYYAPPTGFKSLNTSNLDDPTVKPHEYFAAAKYTGAGGSEEIDLGFTPNLTWIKRRVDSNYYHVLNDSARGLSSGALYSNTTDSEDSVQRVASFDSDSGSEGFTLSSTHASYVNTSGKTYISWNWKESASAGFDIVTYEGDSDTSGDTQSISHSLGVAPEMIIVKARDGRAANDYYARDMWYVWHKDLTSGSSLYLNSTSVEVDYSSGYTSAPISSVGSSTFTVCNAEEYNNYYYDFLNWGDPYGYYTGSNERYVAYLFSSVEGVSKVGSYTGNGSANGPFVYTGFRPAFVMVKPIEASYSWYMHDTARSPYNYSDLELTANSSGAEYSVSGAGGGHRLDILSNGFKHRTSNVAMNQSGYKYAFLAFSESPLKYANGR